MKDSDGSTPSTQKSGLAPNFFFGCCVIFLGAGALFLGARTQLSKRILQDAFDNYLEKHGHRQTVTPQGAETFPSSLFESLGRIAPAASSTISELDRYLALPQCSGSMDPLQWWKTNAADFPVLSMMAMDYLAVQSSSVPAEQIFSGGVDLVTPKRNRISHEKVSMSLKNLMSLKNWISNSSIEEYL
jgi:hypothetical protein